VGTSWRVERQVGQVSTERHNFLQQHITLTRDQLVWPLQAAFAGGYTTNIKLFTGGYTTNIKLGALPYSHVNHAHNAMKGIAKI
jgi:hypothetical protein